MRHRLGAAPTLGRDPLRLGSHRDVPARRLDDDRTGTPDQAGVGGYRGWVKRKVVWIAASVAVLVAIVALTWWGYSRAKQFEALATTGKSDASAALKSLEAKDAASALASFQKAKSEFGQARDLLGPTWLHGLPWLGHQLATADNLTTIGFEGSSAGAEMTELLVGAASVDGGHGLNEVLSKARPHLDSALSSFTVVAQRSEQLSTDGLVPPLADAVQQFEKLIAPLKPLLGRSQEFLDLERYFFSADHRFLLLSQNNAQLRPSGGFIGTYGLVSLGPSGFKLERFEDVYKLPGARSDMPVPEGMGTRAVYFHLANWWLDFPTTGLTMAELWDTIIPAQPKVDGVIAIDLPTIRNLLKVLGPISVPGVNGKLTAKNVFELLSYAVEVEYSGDQGDEGKKNAVVSLAGAVMKRLMTLTEAEFLPVMQALGTSANEKHIQLYLKDAFAQAAMVTAGWSGAIAPSADTTDVVAVANAVMRRPAKSNLGVSKELTYDVTLNAQGGADTTLVLGYTKSADNPLRSLQDVFNNLARVHRATGTTLTGGGKQIETLNDAVGLPTFANSFRLDSGDSTSVTMKAQVPNALRQDSEGTWHYRLLLVKQADLENTRAAVNVRIPDGWTVSAASAVLRVSGTDLPVATADGKVTLQALLSQDILLDLTLTPG